MSRYRLVGAAAALAVVSGALSLHTAHRALAAFALPPLAALVAAAWVAHRRLLGPSVAALGFFLAAALVTGRPLHIAFAALALVRGRTMLGSVRSREFSRSRTSSNPSIAPTDRFMNWL